MEQDAKKRIKEILSDSHACYVLITCDYPKDNGAMNVEMHYDGDPTLASYLLESAQSYVDDESLEFAENEWDESSPRSLP